MTQALARFSSFSLTQLCNVGQGCLELCKDKFGEDMAEVEESEPSVKEDQGNFHFCWFNLKSCSNLLALTKAKNALRILFVGKVHQFLFKHQNNDPGIFTISPTPLSLTLEQICHVLTFSVFQVEEKENHVGRV